MASSNSTLQLVIALRDEASAGISALTGTLGGVGVVATGAAVAGIAGIGVAALNTAREFAEAQRQMQAQLGITADEAEALADVSREVFGNAFGEDIADASAAVAELEQRLGLMGTEGAAALQAASQSAFALRDVFGVELSESAAAAQTLMNEFGMTSAEAMDFITAGFQRGLNSSDDFLESIGEYSNLAAENQATASQFFSILESGMAGGVLGTDKAIDLFKEFGIRIADGSKASADALAQLGLSDIPAQLSAGAITATDAFGIVQSAIASVEDPLLQAQLGVALMGTQFEDLGASAALGIDLAAVSLEDLDGAAASLGVKYENLGSVLSSIWRQSLLTIEPLGTALLELGNAVAPLLMSAFQAVQPSLAALATGLASGVQAVTAFLNALNAGEIPAFSAALSAVGGVLSALSGQFAAAWAAMQQGVAVAGAVLGQLSPMFNALAGQAVGWGQNIVGSLAAGIGQAAAMVIAQLRQIASVITYWLRPGSPPALLPDLDDWGRGAAEAYLEGWGRADVSALNELGGVVEAALSDLVDLGALDQVDLIPTLQDARGALTAVIDEARQFGRVSEESFQAAIAAAGPAGPALNGVLRAYADLVTATQDVERAQGDLAAAQAELNDVTAEYESILAPLNAALDANQSRQQEIRDMQRIQKLQEDLASGKLDALETELAQLQIAEIQQRQGISAVEDEQAAAEAAAQAKVDSAQAALDAATAAQQAAQQQLDDQKAVLEARRAENALITEQIGLLQQLADASAASAGAASGGGGGGGGGGPGLPPLAAMIPGGAAASPVDGLKETVQTQLADVKTTVETELSDAEFMAQAAAGRAAAAAQLAIQNQAAAIIAGAGELAQYAFTEGPQILLNLASGMLAAAPEAINQLGQFAMPLLEAAVPAREAFVTKIGEVVAGLIESIGTYVPSIITAVGQWALAFLSFGVDVQLGLIEQIAGIAAVAIGALGTALPGIITAVGQWALALAQWVVDAAPDILARLGGVVAQLLGAIGAALPGIVESLATWAAAFIAWVIDAAPGLLGELLNLASGLIDWIIGAVPGIASQLGTWALAFLEWVGPAAADLVIALGLMLGDLLGFIIAEAPKIIAAVIEWSKALTEWVLTEALPTALTALGTFVGDLLGYIGGEAVTLITDGAKSVGSALTDGIKAGVQAGWGAFTKWIGDQVALIPEPVRKALGIASPSRVMADLVGEPIVAGIAQGMLDNIGVLLDAAQELSWAVLEEAKVFAQTIEDAIGPLLAESLQGAADFARQQIAGLDLIDALAPKTSDVERLKSEYDKLTDAMDKAWANVIKNDDRIAELEARRDELQAALNGAAQLDPAEQAGFDRRRAQLEARLSVGGMSDSRRQALQDELEDLRIQKEEARAALNDTERDKAQAELDKLETELTGLRDQRAQEAAAHDIERNRLYAQQMEIGRRHQQAELGLIEQRKIQQETEAALAAAQEQALTIADAGERARFLEQQTGQIAEEGKLRQQIAAATTEEERARLEQRLELLRTAQQNEFQIYAGEARERQRQHEAAMRDALTAIEQLGDLVYFTQQDVYGVGSDAILGIAEGMLSEASTINTTLGNILEGAIWAAQQRLGIRSPSRVSGAELGLPFVQGIVRELQDGQATLQLAAQQAMDSMLVVPPIAPLPTLNSGLAPGATPTAASGGDTFNITIQIPAGTSISPELRAYIISAIQEGMRRVGRDTQTRQRMG